MHFAELDQNNVVVRVIVADSKEWCVDNLGGTWARTYYSTPGKVYAGVGYEYIQDADSYRPPKPYESWSFDFGNWQWTAPVPYPEDDSGVPRVWNEETQTWNPVVA